MPRQVDTRCDHTRVSRGVYALSCTPHAAQAVGPTSNQDARCPMQSWGFGESGDFQESHHLQLPLFSWFQWSQLI